MRTMWEALKICLPLTLMTFAIFARPDMVSTTGWSQWNDALIVVAGTCGVAFAMFGRVSRVAAIDIGLRLVLAVVSLVAMLTPDIRIAAAAAVVSAVAIVFGIGRHRQIAPPPLGSIADHEEDGNIRGGKDLDEMAAEAQRDLG